MGVENMAGIKKKAYIYTILKKETKRIKYNYDRRRKNNSY